MRYFDLYNIADNTAYALAFGTCLASIAFGAAPLMAGRLVITSAATSLFAARCHKSNFVKRIDRALDSINIELGCIKINKQTTGTAYSIINSCTKGFMGFALTTALTPYLLSILSGLTILHPVTASSIFYGVCAMPVATTALSIACAAAAAAGISYAFNKFETRQFSIPNNDYKVGVAGTSQQRFLERLIFNGTKEFFPRSFIPALAAGTASCILYGLYTLCGLKTNIHKGEATYKNSLKSLACHAGTQVGKMTLERATLLGTGIIRGIK